MRTHFLTFTPSIICFGPTPKRNVGRVLFSRTHLLVFLTGLVQFEASKCISNSKFSAAQCV